MLKAVQCGRHAISKHINGSWSAAGAVAAASSNGTLEEWLFSTSGISHMCSCITRTQSLSAHLPTPPNFWPLCGESPSIVINFQDSIGPSKLINPCDAVLFISLSLLIDQSMSALHVCPSSKTVAFCLLILLARYLFCSLPAYSNVFRLCLWTNTCIFTLSISKSHRFYLLQFTDILEVSRTVCKSEHCFGSSLSPLLHRQTVW